MTFCGLGKSCEKVVATNTISDEVLRETDDVKVEARGESRVLCSVCKDLRLMDSLEGKRILLIRYGDLNIIAAGGCQTCSVLKCCTSYLLCERIPASWFLCLRHHLPTKGLLVVAVGWDELKNWSFIRMPVKLPRFHNTANETPLAHPILACNLRQLLECQG
jgi:hypothetical protein